MTTKPCIACGKLLNLPHSRESCYEQLLGVRIPELRTELNEAYARIEAKDEQIEALRAHVERLTRELHPFMFIKDDKEATDAS